MTADEPVQDDIDTLAWIGIVESDELRGRDVEELLAKGFGTDGEQ